VGVISVIQAAAHHRPSSVATPATAPASNYSTASVTSTAGKKQFDNQRNVSSVACIGGTRPAGYSQTVGTISASELASLQPGKKL